MIGTGSMSDPYINIPENLQNIRSCLEIINKYGFGLSILTKSNLILNDLDLLKKINRTKCVVQTTFTTLDKDLCKLIEPNVSSTKERFEMLKIMNENGIRTVVWLCPILPFINDTVANIAGLLDYCVAAKVYGIINFGMGLTLREGNREYFYEQLDRNFAGLKEKYIKNFGNNYVLTSPNNKELMAIFNRVCCENNIESDAKKVFSFLSDFDVVDAQLNMF
jgi:DNA repair photolyase